MIVPRRARNKYELCVGSHGRKTRVITRTEDRHVSREIVADFGVDVNGLKHRNRCAQNVEAPKKCPCIAAGACRFGQSGRHSTGRSERKTPTPSKNEQAQ